MNPLKALSPITTVVMISFKEPFQPNLPYIFQTLRLGVESRDLTEYSLSRTNHKIPPDLNLPGEILSMRYIGSVRGIRRSKKTKSFPNSIIMDIGMPYRPVSLKLSSTVEVTGARSIPEALEALNHVIRHLRQAQTFLASLYDRPRNEVQTEIDQYIQENYPDRSYETSLKAINYLLEIKKPIYVGEIEIRKVTTEMVNYQFRLPVTINPSLFAKHIKEPLIATYNQLSRPIVKVQYYHDPESSKDAKKKKKKKSQVFIVNATGTVMFTGCASEQMERVYNTFVKNFYEISHLVKVSGPAKIRYVRSAADETYSAAKLAAQEEQSREYITLLMSGKLPLLPSKEAELPPQVLPSTEVEPPKIEEIPFLHGDYRPLII